MEWDHDNCKTRMVYHKEVYRLGSGHQNLAGRGIHSGNVHNAPYPASVVFLSTEAMIIVTGIWVAFLLVDLVDVMWKMKKDEREVMHEAIAERNAAWGMMLVLVIGLLVELLYYSLQQKIYFDPVIVIALAVGVIVKSVTNYKLDREN
jgi:hypothetical protein